MNFVYLLAAVVVVVGLDDLLNLNSYYIFLQLLLLSLTGDAIILSSSFPAYRFASKVLQPFNVGNSRMAS